MNLTVIKTDETAGSLPDWKFCRLPLYFICQKLLSSFLQIYPSVCEISVYFCTNWLCNVLIFLAVTLGLESIGKGLVHIYSPKARRYIGMDSNGGLFSTVIYLILCSPWCFPCKSCNLLYIQALNWWLYPPSQGINFKFKSEESVFQISFYRSVYILSRNFVIGKLHLKHIFDVICDRNEYSAPLKTWIEYMI